MIKAQIRNHSCNIFAATWSPSWCFLVGDACHFINRFLFVRTTNVTWTYHVNRNSIRGFFNRECLCKRYQTHFGSRIYGAMRPRSRFSSMTEAKMDNASPLLASHLWQYTLIQQHRSQQISLHKHLDLSFRIIRK
ncbi:hypothetical protein D3C76_1321940 [compost metagenome]